MRRIQIDYKPESSSAASSSAALTPTQFLNQNPIFKKASGEFIAKKFRLEFERRTSIRPECKRRAQLLQNVASRKSTIINTHSAKRPRKRRFLSYTQMRKEREEYRKCLVRLIMGSENEQTDDGTFPNAEERKLLRYYYYIRHGIDTIHVAPLSSKVMQKIMNRIPSKLLKYTAIIDANVEEVKNSYIFGTKKSVVNFILGESLEKTYKIDENLSADRRELHELRKRFLTKNKQKSINVALIKRNLFTINPCVSKMLELWECVYTKQHFVRVDELAKHSKSFDLTEFTTIACKHIDDMKEILSLKWYETLKTIIANAVKRKWIPDATKPRSLSRFFNCVGAQMTQHLQDIAIRSLHQFTEFICGKSFPSIRLHVLLEDEDRLVFSPTFGKVQTEMTQIVDGIVNAVQSFDRLESKITMFQAQQFSQKCLKPVIADETIDECRKRISNMLEEQRIGPELRLQDFDDYMSLMNGADADRIYNFMNDQREFDEYCELINHYNDVEHEICMNVWGVISMGFYEFNRTSLIDTLEALARFMQTELLTKMVADQQSDMAKLQSEYEFISQQSLTVPNNTAELMSSKAYVTEMQNVTIPEMENRLRLNLQHFLWLMDQTIYTPLEIKQNSITFQWYLRMASVFNQNQKIIEEKTQEYQELLRKRIEQFRRDLDLYCEQLLEYENWGDIALVSKYKRKANILDSRLMAAMEKIERINEEETSYDWPRSEYPLRKQTHDKLLPYKMLFDAGQDFIEKRDLWLKSQVGSFDPIDIGNDIASIYEIVVKLADDFEANPQSKRLAEDIKVIIDEFKLNMPIIQTLGNPGMKLRHWEQISEMVGFPITVSAELTLEKIIEFGLEDYLARFEKISQSATKENNLETAMSNMVVEWQGIEFVVQEYRDSGTYILCSINDIQTLLDDHIIKTQTMKNSPYIKPFETEILAWESKLVLLQDILDDWLRVQATWIYLEPIFSSPDIQQQMPEEGRRFGAVDKIWKDLMKQVHGDPAVMSVVEIDKMSEKLKKAFNLLEIIQKGLNTYLEKKRLYFPRFFFLSNDGLLEILAETKEPTRVQPHLKKCFDGIDSLTFNDSNEITAMNSHANEQITFAASISTTKARGQVEKWLHELEKSMKESISNEIQKTMVARTEQSLIEWIEQWPGQCIHTNTMHWWSEQAELSLVSANAQASFAQLSKQLDDDIAKVLGLLRSNTSHRHRITAEGLIILLTQAQDITHRLIELRAHTKTDFNWLSQLRVVIGSKTIEIRLLHSSIAYGYEYLGNRSRLVITALTDRCYRTIFSAFHHKMSIALMGSAACGKTELVKDLSKTVAKKCVIYNCSSGLDYIAMGNFFKGIAACGAWTCFDEFNRIDVKVLSSVAQQLQTIRQAISTGCETFQFEGVQLPLDTNCGIFVTMTSDSGLNRLPGNLKSLFRPIALTAPDIGQIASIELKSCGYENAHSLAVKIVTIFRLCNEYLPSKPHYDFGMRSIKAILSIAKTAKAEKEVTDEEVVIAKAICGYNLCKLDEIDVGVFRSIFNDIFPDKWDSSNSEMNNSSTTSLIRAVKDACAANNVDCTEYFLMKIQQFYQLLQMAAGVILIGDAYSGKTTLYRTLANALALCGERNELNEMRPECKVLNPKSLSLGQIFGEFGASSHEWHDGILPIIFRKFTQSTTNERKLLIFDGPIDSSWVENLNSVLDDNRKLCLSSGDIIYMQKSMNLIFETSELDSATPSTISRCGIVFMESRSLGWTPLVHAWQCQLPSVIQDVNKHEIMSLFMRFCPILLWFIRHGAVAEMLTTSDSGLIASLINLFDCFMDEYRDEKYTANLSELDIRAQLEGIFSFACIWSFGGSLNESSRDLFSELFHGLSLKEFPSELYEKFQIPDELQVAALIKPFIFSLPKVGSVFDYRFIKEGKGKWKLWSDEIALAPVLPRDIPVNQIIITTKETVRIGALLDLLVRHNKPVLLVGPTATGKTIYANDFLAKKIDQSVYTSICINFSVGTTANQVQEIIMSRLDKRRKGVFGPPLGKRCVMFVDDLSMPFRDGNSTAQPPVELMRFWLDHSMWYDQKSLAPVKLIDLQIMCAMTASRGTVSPRFLRHFNVIAIDEFTGDTLKSIFSKIILWHLDARGFSKEFDPCIDEIVLGTLFVHIEATKVLLPTPSKCHYLFNVRDFSRVIQGVLLSVPEATDGIDAMRRLWAHEVQRIYGDRLIDAGDRKWLFDAMCLAANAELNTTPAELFGRFIEPNKELQPEDMHKLMYCDFTNPKADTRNYLEVQEIDELRYVVESYLVEFNNMTKRPMNLVMFRYAIEHLSRICRVLKQPRSHALIIGIGGSGRQSFTRLAAHIMDFELFQIEMNRNYSLNDWQEFLKAMLLKISCTEAHGVFLFADTQMKHPQFLDDINNLLKSGEILSLFNADELKDICEKMHAIDKQRDKSLQTDGTTKALYNFFTNVRLKWERDISSHNLTITSCHNITKWCMEILKLVIASLGEKVVIKEQLHIILTVSPLGDTFRKCTRNYPSMINCCTIDWYHGWPDDALLAIAHRFLAEEEEGLNETDRGTAIEMLVEFQTSTMEMADEYYQQTRNPIFIPSVTYIDCIHTFTKQMQLKKAEFHLREQRFRRSLERLAESATQVTVMQKSIESLEPQLKTASDKISKQVLDVQSAQEATDEQRELVKQEEQITSERTIVADELNEACKSIMDEVIVSMQEAETALSTLTPADVSALRTMKSPPVTVKIVMEAVCILKEIKTDKMSASTDEYWTASKKLLADPAKFIESILTFDKDAISDTTAARLHTKIISNDAFDPEKVKLVSMAGELLSRWVIAISQYDKAFKAAAPKRAEYTEAAGARDAATASLNAKIEELRMLEENLGELQKQLTMEKAKFENLKAEHERCTKRLTRANEIVGCLGGENERWLDVVRQIQEKSQTLLTDSLVAAGVVAYLGQFPESYRSKRIAKWLEKCSTLGLPHNVDFKLDAVYGDAIQVKSWKILGLPSDRYSIGSALILQNTRRWTLMIDPQGHANKWIKNLEKGNRLCVIRLNQPDYLRVLENAIQYGLPVLLENVGHDLEPILDSVLFQEVFKQSGTMNVRLGENIVEYNDAFKFYMTTKLHEPCYSAEVSGKVAILNFAITDDGLHEYLLGVTVARERPDVEAEKNQLIVQQVDTKRTLRDEEEKIIGALAADSNVLDDDAAVQAISMSKMMINELIEKLNVAKVTEKQIDACRMAYAALAEHAAVLYFTIVDMIKLNPMYQYSLVWFVGHFTAAIDNTDKVDDVQQRVKDLIKYFTYFIYTKVCRSLYEEDKMVFTALISKNLSEKKGDLCIEEWQMLTTRASNGINMEEFPNWLPIQSWLEICRLSRLKSFESLTEAITTNEPVWKDYFESTKQQKILCENIPEPFGSQMNYVQKLILFKCFQPSKFVHCIEAFVMQALGAEFLEPPLFNLSAAFAESTCCNPLLFLLPTDFDPMPHIFHLADSQLINRNRLVCLSLGEQQSAHVMKFIEEAIKNGNWIILQNCHMAEEWMPALERICENLAPDSTHADFRLWLTIDTVTFFPLTVLHNCIKLTMGRPMQRRANILSSFTSEPICNDQCFNATPGGNTFKSFLYTLCIMHAAIQERRRYGTNGWNCAYDFDERDLQISVEQTLTIWNEQEIGAFDMLRYFIAECNYGGHIADEWDRRCLITLVEQLLLQKPDLIDTSTLRQNFPNDGKYESFVTHIKGLPLDGSATDFGLHSNAEILREQNESNRFLNRFALSECRVEQSVEQFTESNCELIATKAREILSNIPSPFNLNFAGAKDLEVNGEASKDCMSVILLQELLQYNDLLNSIRADCEQVLVVIKGNAGMDENTEALAESILTGCVPAKWMSKSYPSLKSFANYINDLKLRIEFWQTWQQQHRMPALVWISAFFSPHAFLAGILLNYSRQNGVPYDALTFEHVVKDDGNDITEAPHIGCFINGMYLDGAAWCSENHHLMEPKGGLLFDEMPTIWLRPMQRNDDAVTEQCAQNYYKCPVYKTLERRTSTLQSKCNANYFTSVRLKCDEKVRTDVLILRGCALVCQLNN